MYKRNAFQSRGRRRGSFSARKNTYVVVSFCVPWLYIKTYEKGSSNKKVSQQVKQLAKQAFLKM